MTEVQPPSPTGWSKRRANANLRRQKMQARQPVRQARELAQRKRVLEAAIAINPKAADDPSVAGELRHVEAELAAALKRLEADSVSAEAAGDKDGVIADLKAEVDLLAEEVESLNGQLAQAIKERDEAVAKVSSGQAGGTNENKPGKGQPNNKK